MGKLTPEEIRESDVEYVVPDGTELPEKVRKTLEHFSGLRVQNKLGVTGTRYVIPAYLAREWLEQFT
jgi:hypothetical protein